jgi:hypothetical protein
MRFAAALSVGFFAVIQLTAAGPAGAQNSCPFPAFCGTAQGQCHINCGALTEVIPWSARSAFSDYCSAKCDAEAARCQVRTARRCARLGFR